MSFADEAKEYLKARLIAGTIGILTGSGSSSDGTINRGEGFNLNEFQARLNERSGVARPHLFLVKLRAPEILIPFLNTDTISFFVDGVNVPTVSHVPMEYKPLGYGNMRRIPGQAIFDEITMNVMADNRGQMQNFFYLWHNNISYSMIKDGNRNNAYESLAGQSDELRARTAYSYKYIKEYRADIEILAFDEAQNKIVEYKFFEAYPSTITGVNYNWNDNDNIARFAVSFQFRDMDVNVVAEPFESSPGGSARLTGFQRLIRVGTAAASLYASIKKPQQVGDIQNVINNAKLFKDSFGF